MQSFKATGVRSNAIAVATALIAIAVGAFMFKDSLMSRFGFIPAQSGVAHKDGPACIEKEHAPDIYFVSCGGFI